MGRMEKAVNRNTPTVLAHESRGLAVREIAFYRHPDPLDETQVRITGHRFSASGFLKQSADPRLADQGLANFIYTCDLRGNALYTRSLDAGISVNLKDTAGRPLLTVSGILGTGDSTGDHSQAVNHSWHYEVPTLPGRPLAVSEQVASGDPRTTQRFIYAASTAADKDRNIAGLCISHYDTAGLVATECMALSGVRLATTRRLPKAATDPGMQVDWHGADPAAWNTLLAPETYPTVTCADATGNVLLTQDAADHQQRVTYGVNGQLACSWLTVKDSAEQPVVTTLAHSAAGQKLSETHGNGVTCTYQYEPRTQRMANIRVERASGLLQDLRYRYDPVGNVLNARDEAQQTRIWRNQRVEPESLYGYDSLYQLVSASGREMANAGRQNSQSTPTSLPLASDNTTYTRYTRHYHYDTAGNLTQIRHSAPATHNSYTTDITISNRSNRGVTSSLAGTPEEVDALFTAAGHQRQLQPGQALEWTPRGELQKVTPVVRDGAPGDHELYRYDAHCQRVLKSSTQQLNTQQVIYLANLELRTTEKENLQVLCVGEAGNAKVRALHWVAGKPAEIANDQVRYAYRDLIGSHGLEIDGSGDLISREEYYPYGETSVWAARNAVEADYKTVRFSGKERDSTGLYYYSYRYYLPWAGRWLKADPAETVDGLNLYCMVQNNPGTYADANGLMLTFTAQGLSQFPADEADIVMRALDTARLALRKTLDLDPLDYTVEMETFFGPEYQRVEPNIVDAWQRIEGMLTDYAKPEIGHKKIFRTSELPSNLNAAAVRNSFEGNIVIADGFFVNLVTEDSRAAAITHEISHLRRVTGLQSVSVGSQDFFYIDFNDPSEDSFKIAYEGKLRANYVEDPIGLFNEIATENNYQITRIDKNFMHYIEKQKSGFLNLSSAVSIFNTSSSLRARVTSKNADSLAHSAMAIAASL